MIPAINTSSSEKMVSNEGVKYPLNQQGAFAVPSTSSRTAENGNLFSLRKEAKATERWVRDES